MQADVHGRYRPVVEALVNEIEELLIRDNFFISFRQVFHLYQSNAIVGEPDSQVLVERTNIHAHHL